jgi:flavin reductase (DIM6/NTAB) family NADH-FMN oxidoreductase RutF
MTQPLNQFDFRQAMRMLAGGVSVITVGTGADRTGLTATSVTSLSAEPPRLMTCINKSSSAWPILSEYRTFGINLLSAEQTDLANRFAGRGGEKGVQRYEGSQWYTAVSGAPLLVDALAAIDCTVEEVIERHSHAIVIGRIEAVKVAQDDSPLIYWSGDYRTIAYGLNF